MAIFFVVNTHTRSMHTWIWCLCFSVPVADWTSEIRADEIFTGQKKNPARWTFSFFLFKILCETDGEEKPPMCLIYFVCV